MSLPSISHNAVFMPLFLLGGFLIGQIEPETPEMTRCVSEELAQQTTNPIATNLILESHSPESPATLRIRHVAGKQLFSI